MFALHSKSRLEWRKVQKVLDSLWEALLKSAETPPWREIPVRVAQPHLEAVLQVCGELPTRGPGVHAEVGKQLCEGKCRSPFREMIKGSRHSSKQSLK